MLEVIVSHARAHQSYMNSFKTSQGLLEFITYLASKPISRSLSASSNTNTSRDFTQLARSSPSAFLLNRSSKRPGVATMMFPLFANKTPCGFVTGQSKDFRGAVTLLSQHRAAFISKTISVCHFSLFSHFSAFQTLCQCKWYQFHVWSFPIVSLMEKSRHFPQTPSHSHAAPPNCSTSGSKAPTWKPRQQEENRNCEALT